MRRDDAPSFLAGPYCDLDVRRRLAHKWVHTHTFEVNLPRLMILPPSWRRGGGLAALVLVLDAEILLTEAQGWWTSKMRRYITKVMQKWASTCDSGERAAVARQASDVRCYHTLTARDSMLHSRRRLVIAVSNAPQTKPLVFSTPRGPCTTQVESTTILSLSPEQSSLRFCFNQYPSHPPLLLVRRRHHQKNSRLVPLLLNNNNNNRDRDSAQ